MKKFKRKAITHILEAIQFNGLDDYLEIVKWVESCTDNYTLNYSTPIMTVSDGQGTMALNVGDYLCRGGNNYFYSCKSSVLDDGYDEVTN